MPQVDEDPDYPGDIVYPQFYTTPYPKYAPNGLALWGNIRLRQQGPGKGLEIPQDIYEKAGSRNDELTQSERTLLLSRGDAIGKALAYPKSLTLAEKYEAMGWMNLDELHAAIRQASGGTISQASELMARAKASLQSLNFEEILLLANQFRADQSLWFRRQQFPGNSEACRLITAQEAIDNELFYQAQAYLMDDPKLRKAGYARYLAAEENEETGLYIQLYEPKGFRKIPAHVLAPTRYPFPPLRRELTPEPPTKDLDSSGHFVPTRRDGVDSVTGQRHWPGFFQYDDGFYPLSPKKLFMRDLMRKNGTKKKPLSDVELSDQYHALPAEEQSEYEARAETVRLAAWERPTGNNWKQLDKLALPREQETPGLLLAPEVDLTGRREGPRCRDGTDLAGNPDWPMLINLHGAYPLPPDQLLALDLKRTGETGFMIRGQELETRYDALLPEEKAELETRSEVLRQAAWDEWEEGGWEKRPKFGRDTPNWEQFDSLNVLPPWRKAVAQKTSS
ncbi:hypothetical protein PG996_006570 [Apiospora saccharicola]|uniref:Uncharacterized protein n=1 Tax=Apiospora saccharicola TaxID=335842 RepID=A0ABR1VBZ6_9PEZI